MTSATLRAGVATLMVVVHCAIGFWLVRRGMRYEDLKLYVALGVLLILYVAGRI
jgi:hypothetical protein